MSATNRPTSGREIAAVDIVAKASLKACATAVDIALLDEAVGRCRDAVHAMTSVHDTGTHALRVQRLRLALLFRYEAADDPADLAELLELDLQLTPHGATRHDY